MIAQSIAIVVLAVTLLALPRVIQADRDRQEERMRYIATEQACRMIVEAGLVKTCQMLDVPK